MPTWVLLSVVRKQPPNAAKVNAAVGREIRCARTRRGLVMDDVYPQVDIGKNAYMNYELGRAPLTVATMFAICEVLRVKPADLLATVEREHPEVLNGHIPDVADAGPESEISVAEERARKPKPAPRRTRRPREGHPRTGGSR